VCRGGFSAEAAKSIAGAGSAELAALIDKSLLKNASSGRYEIHELLRQYAEAKLGQAGREVRDRHRAYYATYAATLQDDLHGTRQREALGELSVEAGNLRWAWRSAVDESDLASLVQLADASYYLWQMQSRYQEGLDALQAAIARLEGQSAGEAIALALARLRVYQGWLYLRLGRPEPARQVLTAARETFGQHGDPMPRTYGGDPRTALGVLALIEGQFAEAARLGQEALAASRGRSDQWNEMFALYVLANAAADQGSFDTGRQFVEQAYAIAAAAGERWFRAYLYSDLGRIAAAQGELELARDCFEASYAIREAFNDPEGMAAALIHLADLTLLQGKVALAQTHYDHGLALYRNLGDRGGLSAAEHGLARVALSSKDLERARLHLREGLRLAAEIAFVPRLLALLVSASEWQIQRGQPRSATRWLQVARHHPASSRETRDRAERILQRVASDLPALRNAPATAGSDVNLQAILVEVRASLDASTAGPAPADADDETMALPGPAPAEAFTPRELEVLRLIGEGGSNKEIAGRLQLSIGTVKWYTSQIFAKLQANSRLQAINQARARGLLG
jgi:ATP/maltotriose-dependent transcriptional regulator MalT